MNTLEQTIVNQAKDTAQLLALLEISHISGSGMSAEGIAAREAVEAEYAAMVRSNNDHGNHASVAATDFALKTEDGLGFLRCWNEGNFEAIHDEWPEAPEEIFIGADQFHEPSAVSPVL